MTVVETTDHDEIREWIEKQNGHPAKLVGRVLNQDNLRLKFGNIRQTEDIEKVSWQDFFGLFEEEGMVFRYRQNSERPAEQRFEFAANDRGAMMDEKKHRDGG